MIATKIDQIVAVRKGKLELVKKVKLSAEKDYVSVKKIESLQRRLLDNDEKDSVICLLKQQPEVRNNIMKIDLNRFNKLYKKYIDELERIEARFSRETLNISFVGAAGQGKSMVLQSISGLNGDVIPSGEGTDCTGAKSIISNSNNDKTYAEITFYNADELVAIINDYLTEISGNTNYHISMLSQVPSIPIEKIREKIALDTSAIAKLKQLEKYVEHINDEEIALNIGKVITVEENDIEKYVAQHSCKNSNILYFNYLAVKCADIKCTFPKKDSGKIVLVDTKGLGDTALKVNENMLETAERDSDAIILLYRPDPLRGGLQQREVDIIKMISERISPEYCQQLLFWVLNKVQSEKGCNVNIIAEAKESIVSGNYPVAGVLDVDCSNAIEVENLLLNPVLDSIVERIENVDKFIVNKFNCIAIDLENEYKNVTSVLNDVFLDSVDEDIKKEMLEVVNGTIDQMLDSMRNIFLDLDKKRTIPCDRFKEASEKKLKEVLDFVPNKTQILDLLKKGSSNHIDVYQECTNIIRMRIIDSFLELDKILKGIVDDMKQSVIDVLVDETKGKLASVVSKQDVLPDEWIKDFLDSIDKKGNKYPLIVKAFSELKSFKISVEGFLIYEVRDKLDDIDPSLHAQTPEIIADVSNKDAQAEDIAFWLSKYISDIHSKLRACLVEFYAVPNRALFAASKDFFDRVTYAQVNTYRTVKEEWRYLYEEYMPVIWKEEYAAKMNSIEAYEDWNKLLEEVDSANESLTILND